MCVRERSRCGIFLLHCDAIAKPLISRLLQGFRCTLLTYGQTGSGKTHTIFGPPGGLTKAPVVKAGGAVPLEWGLLPRIALVLLSDGQEAGVGGAREGLGSLYASAIEVYQDSA